MNPSCRLQVLATNPIGSVEWCSCGSVHLCVGAFTVRLDPKAFLQLAALVGDARLTLMRSAVEAPRPAPAGTVGVD